MKLIIILEYLINLFTLLFFHMHMFQLNSYFFKKQMRWMKANTKKIIPQIISIILPTILLCFNNIVTNILAMLLLALSIFNNLPKGKAKIS